MTFYRLLTRTTICKTATFGSFPAFRPMSSVTMNGDLNNTAAERLRKEIAIDPEYRNRSFAISPSQDDSTIRKSYRPFLINDELPEDDWIAQLELSTALKMVEASIINNGGDRLKVLVLHGSMRSR